MLSLCLLASGCASWRENLHAAREKCENAGGTYNLVQGGCVYNVHVTR